MIKYLKNERGESDILGFIIVAPIFLWFFLYIIFGGSFILEKNQMQTIVNKSLDEALVEGQYIADLQQTLKTELINSGFSDESKLEITITPTEAGDMNNTTYAVRGELVKITVIYKNPHVFYHTNFRVGGENKYYIGVQIEGMSEKW